MNSQKSSINILTLFYYWNNLNVSYLFKEIDTSEMEKKCDFKLKIPQIQVIAKYNDIVLTEKK